VAPFSILTVCSGNICRSPLAEQLLRAGTREWSEVTVASAGTTALVGEPMTEQAQALSFEFGGDGAETHRARELTEEQLRDADLVLGLSREHRRAIVELYPRATRHAFTLREFARLVAGITDDDLEHAATLSPTDIVGRLTELVEVAAVDVCWSSWCSTAAGSTVYGPSSSAAATTRAICFCFASEAAFTSFSRWAVRSFSLAFVSAMTCSWVFAGSATVKLVCIFVVEMCPFEPLSDSLVMTTRFLPIRLLFFAAATRGESNAVVVVWAMAGFSVAATSEPATSRAAREVSVSFMVVSPPSVMPGPAGVISRSPESCNSKQVQHVA
jgi:protein-tyrosine phosphatase